MGMEILLWLLPNLKKQVMHVLVVESDYCPTWFMLGIRKPMTVKIISWPDHHTRFVANIGDELIIPGLPDQCSYQQRYLAQTM